MLAMKSSIVCISLWIILANGVVQNEPSCSKFTYDEQLLGKRLKVESKVEKWNEEVQKFQGVVLSLLENRRREMQIAFETQNEKIASCLQENSKLNDKIGNITGANTGSSTIAFNAYTKSGGSYNINQVIVFPEVLLNIGQGYNNVTGYFTAPVAGLYHFTAQICVNTGSAMVASIFHGSTRLSSSTAHTGVFCVSTSAIAIVEEGETVCVKSSYSDSQLLSDGYRRPSFIGILINRKSF